MSCENVMPYILEDAAGKLVVHARCEEPLAVVNEALNGHFLYALPRHGELRAADAGNGRRDGSTRVDLLPDVAPPVDLLGLVEEVEVAAAVTGLPVPGLFAQGESQPASATASEPKSTVLIMVVFISHLPCGPRSAGGPS